MISAAFLAALTAAFAVGADGGSKTARLFVEFPATTNGTRWLFLLEREEVQQDIHLTSEQLAAVRREMDVPDDPPGAAGIRDRLSKAQSDSSIAEPERGKLILAIHRELEAAEGEWLRERLRKVLSKSQAERIEELTLQMRGPTAILESSGIAKKLRIDKATLSKLRDDFKPYEEDTAWLKGMLGRRLFRREYRSESREDQLAAIEALYTLIRVDEKGKDAEILSYLTPEQAAAWKSLQGTPLPIDWPKSSFLHIPFHKSGPTGWK